MAFEFSPNSTQLSNLTSCQQSSPYSGDVEARCADVSEYDRDRVGAKPLKILGAARHTQTVTKSIVLSYPSYLLRTRSLDPPLFRDTLQVYFFIGDTLHFTPADPTPMGSFKILAAASP